MQSLMHFNIQLACQARIMPSVSSHRMLLLLQVQKSASLRLPTAELTFVHLFLGHVAARSYVPIHPFSVEGYSPGCGVSVWPAVYSFL